MPESTGSPKQQQHINPEHFPDNNRPARAQNFSFASSYPYAPGRNSSSSTNNNSNPQQQSYNVQRYQSPYNFHHVVTNAFSVLHNSVEGADYEFAANPKPNQAIVRPTIREPADHVEQRAPAGAINSSNPPPLTTRSFFSRSTQEVRSFADELSQKLRFLAPEENYGLGGGGGSSAHSNTSGSGAWLAAARQMERPRFETTVPTGIFLPPPSELQLLPATMLRRHVYAYSSYPMILHSYYNAAAANNNSNSNNYNNPNRASKESRLPVPDKENRSTANTTRQAGVRATAAVAAAAAAAAAVASKSDTESLAGGLHITKAQFQQQLQQRRNNNNNNNRGDKR